MTTAVLEELEEPTSEPAPRARPTGDTLAASVLILLVMTVVQRLVGFGRGIMFCRWLEPEQLGQWDVAFGFLNLAAPLALLGLPGSFGRYVEYYRHRGQFHTFLRRTTWVCAVMSIVAAVTMVVFRNWFAELIFGLGEPSSIMIALALCLTVVILHNALVSLFIAVRRYRFVTLLQFAQSVGFAVVSLLLLNLWPAGATSVVIGYAVATVLSAICSLQWLRRITADEPRSVEEVPQGAFWAKLLPFAIWMWVTNLLANLFEVIDRYMIVHHSGMEANEALRQIGFYHSSRIVPMLFVGVAGLLGSMITPHLSHDWECGRRVDVERRLNLVLKLLLGSLFAASVAVLFVAPWLFHVAFQNKFPGGLDVLPLTLTYCAWFGTIAVAQNYLWCAERPGLSSSALFIGLIVNVCTNLVLLPRYGLEGAVVSTTLANLTALSLIYVFSAIEGMRVDSGTWALSLLPITLSLGPWPALAVLAVLLVITVTSNRVLIADEKHHIRLALAHGRQRVRRITRQVFGPRGPLENSRELREGY